MKPDCRRVLSQIASYSVEELSPADIDAFTRHLDDCPPCKGQWLLFEKTLVTLSQTPEAEIEVERSQQMWVACLEHAKTRNPSVALNSTDKVEVLPQPSHSGSTGVEGDRRSPLVSPGAHRGTPGWLQLLRNAFAPRLGYVTAGFAALALGAAYFLSPSTPTQAPASRVAFSLPIMPEVKAKSASFQTPPYATTGMLDYHSAMSFEPFSDHVAPTLVSYTATQP
jgi:hypothetical protein